MTKTQLQQELLEKVKLGTKPSHLKKLKKSKSADDIPAPSSHLSELETENQELKNQLAQTTLALEELTKLKTNPPTQLLQDQLKEKQQQIEALKKELESKPTLPELDRSLLARHQNLKDWFTQYQKNKKLDAELTHNIDEASTELINQDEQIANLQTQITKLKLTNQQLTKDLNLSQRLAELRKDNPFNPHPDYLKYALYGLTALILVLWLTNTK